MVRYDETVPFYRRMKQNTNCPASEKGGKEGPGSCGGATKKEGSLERGRGATPKEVKEWKEKQPKRDTTPAGYAGQKDFDRVGMRIAREKGGISNLNKAERELLSNKAIKKLEEEEKKAKGSSSPGASAVSSTGKSGAESKMHDLIDAHFKEMDKNGGDTDTNAGSELESIIDDLKLTESQREAFGHAMEEAKSPAVLKQFVSTKFKSKLEKMKPSKPADIKTSNLDSGHIEYKDANKKSGDPNERAIVKGNVVTFVNRNNFWEATLGSEKEAQSAAKKFVNGSKDWLKMKTIPRKSLGEKYDFQKK
jgi:hypothetical protein